MNPKLAYVTLVYIFGIFDIVITYFRENSNIRMWRKIHLVPMLIRDVPMKIATAVNVSY